MQGNKLETILGEISRIVHDFQPKITKLPLNMDNFGPASSGEDTGLLQLFLNIQIERGPDGV